MFRIIVKRAHIFKRVAKIRFFFFWFFKVNRQESNRGYSEFKAYARSINWNITIKARPAIFFCLFFLLEHGHYALLCNSNGETFRSSTSGRYNAKSLKHNDDNGGEINAFLRTGKKSRHTSDRRCEVEKVERQIRFRINRKIARDKILIIFFFFIDYIFISKTNVFSFFFFFLRVYLL